MSENLRALVSGGDAATLAAIREACRSFARSGSLDAAVSVDDLVSEAIVSVLDGRADSVDDAARAAFSVGRFDRLDGVAVRFQYLSSVLGENEDGTIDTLGDVLADRVTDRSSAGVDPATLDYDSLARAAGSVRVAKGYAAHGSVMARGAANAVRGALNDADTLRALEAVGGRRYGYAAAMVRWFASEGIITTANAVRVAVHRALSRTEGGHHSDRC